MAPGDSMCHHISVYPVVACPLHPNKAKGCDPAPDFYVDSLLFIFYILIQILEEEEGRLMYNSLYFSHLKLFSIFLADRQVFRNRLLTLAREACITIPVIARATLYGVLLTHTLSELEVFVNTVILLLPC